jgi:hypothetical protein
MANRPGGFRACRTLARQERSPLEAGDFAAGGWAESAGPADEVLFWDRPSGRSVHKSQTAAPKPRRTSFEQPASPSQRRSARVCLG